MQIVGITGGIGSGKTVVTRILRAMGYPVYDSDTEAKRIMHQDERVVRELCHAFGESVFIDGQLDRNLLAQEVFGNEQRLLLLNSIVHPAVREDIRRWGHSQTSSLAFLESAILFESGFESEADNIVLVTAPDEIRMKRVMQRDRCTPEQVMQRMARQWPEERKMKLADFVIHNDETHPLIPQVEEIIGRLNGCWHD